jgi:hypothetical protein
MPSEIRTELRRPRHQRWLAPHPHPSWSGETLPDLAQPLAAAEFWKRLGL